MQKINLEICKHNPRLSPKKKKIEKIYEKT